MVWMWTEFNSLVIQTNGLLIWTRYRTLVPLKRGISLPSERLSASRERFCLVESTIPHRLRSADSKEDLNIALRKEERTTWKCHPRIFLETEKIKNNWSRVFGLGTDNWEWGFQLHDVCNVSHYPTKSTCKLCHLSGAMFQCILCSLKQCAVSHSPVMHKESPGLHTVTPHLQLCAMSDLTLMMSILQYSRVILSYSSIDVLLHSCIRKETICGKIRKLNKRNKNFLRSWHSIIQLTIIYWEYVNVYCKLLSTSRAPQSVTLIRNANWMAKYGRINNNNSSNNNYYYYNVVVVAAINDRCNKFLCL
jgi:hypothetical protein